MGMAEIGLFKAAMRNLQSGSYAGNYTLARRPAEGREAAYGAYQISDSNWEKWTGQLGLHRAQWSDKKAQDVVADAKFRQLYKRYGDWRLVAVAWEDGTGAADAVAAVGRPGDYENMAREVTKGMRQARAKGYSNAQVEPILSVEKPMRKRDLTPAPGQEDALAQQAAYQPTAPTPPAPDEAEPAAPGAAPVPPEGAPAPPPVPAPVGESSGTMSDADIEHLESSHMHRNMAQMLQALSNSIKTGAANLVDEATVDTSEASVDTTDAKVDEDFIRSVPQRKAPDAYAS